MAEENQEPLTFTEMGDAFAEPPKKETTFTSDIRGIEKAADALEETRAAEKEPISRKYIQVGGEHDGEDMPPDRSIDLKRAVADISRQREFERGAAEHEGAEVLANEVDAYRAAEQAKQQPQQQAQPEVQPQISPEQALPPGVDPEIADALTRSPKLRAAVEAELSKADHARQQFAQASHLAAQAAVESILSDFPELIGLDGNQIGAVVQAMAVNAPERHQQLTAKLQRAEQIHRMSEQAKSVQARIFQEQLASWTKSEDQRMDQYLATEPQETVRQVKDNLVKVMSDVYGADKNELAHAFATTPLLRSSVFQRALCDLVKHHMAQAQISDKKYRDAPPVQRPGVAGDRPSGDEVETSRAYQKFLKDPNPRSAAAFIMSKRSVRR